MDESELDILERLDRALTSELAGPAIEELVARAERMLAENPQEVLAWEPIPLALYPAPLPAGVRSSWVFVLRRGTVTGAERHPNSHQRMMSYRGAGDFQTRTDGPWESHVLTSDRSKPIPRRWISIPPNVWHQGVVPSEDWVVVSFHTASEAELIEERPATDGEGTRQRRYADR